MATTVSMPQLGETVTEGTILKWAKSVGDTIAEDEVLVEISTDKVDTEVPSPAAGVITEILVQEGETVEVGTDLCVIGDADESGGGAAGGEPAGEPEESETASDPDAEPPAAEPEQAAAEPEGVPTEPESEAEPELAESSAPPPAPNQESADAEPRLLSPVVRKLAREHEIDLAKVSGTGQGGRITRRDVEAFIESGPAEAAAEPAAPAASPEPTAQPAASQEPAPAASQEPAPAAPPTPAPVAASSPTVKAAPAPAAGEGAEEVEIDRLRVRIAENMVRSKQTAAHVWTSVEVDYEKVERVRQAHKEAFKQEEGFSLTYLPFIARATIDALKAYPVVNSAFHLEERVSIRHKSVNLGIAVDLDQKGLVVAGVRNADGLRLVGLARSIAGLADKARSGKLDPDDVTGATFTITNPGPFGSFMSAPVINVPNVGILSTDTIAKRPTVVTGVDGGDVIAIRHIGYLGLSWDHRAFDGSTAVLFLRRIKENLETWDWEQELN